MGPPAGLRQSSASARNRRSNAPFWSPDSQSLGFFTFDSKLKKISLSEGTSKHFVMPAGHWSYSTGNLES